MPLKPGWTGLKRERERQLAWQEKTKRKKQTNDILLICVADVLLLSQQFNVHISSAGEIFQIALPIYAHIHTYTDMQKYSAYAAWSVTNGPKRQSGAKCA